MTSWRHNHRLGGQRSDHSVFDYLRGAEQTGA
jgi:hypothetical protein